MKRPWILAECDQHDIKSRRIEVAVLPWGATEAHNYHLPYGTDNFQVTDLAERGCEVAYKAGADVVCLPTIPFGINSNTMGFPMNMNMHCSTQLAVLRDVVDSLKTHGVPKLLLLNGHGGNEFRGTVRELFGCGVFIAVSNWWQFCAGAAEEIFDELGEHANEMESSVMLHLRPELVDMSLAADGSTRKPRLASLEKEWIWIARPWDRFTKTSGFGNPAAATAEKGEAFLDACAGPLGEVIRELAQTEIDEWFPYEGPE